MLWLISILVYLWALACKTTQTVLGQGGWVSGIGQSAGGQSSVSFPGGQAFSNVTTLAHGLGTTPVSAVACSNVVNFAALAFAVTYDSTNIYVQGSYNSVNPGAGSVQGFNWMAFA